jgi:DNA transposition AAA+ family ATPase
MNDFVKTTSVTAAIDMAHAVMAAPYDARAGQIIGPPGTGKTAIGAAIQKEFGAIRICAWEGMGKKVMLEKIAEKLGINTNVGCDTMIVRILNKCSGRLIVIDEANHLRWNVIEMLRIFIDEGFAGLILVGTDLLDQTFRSARTEIYLAQMAQRIGTKRVMVKPLQSAQEIAAYVITPRFGAVSAKTATAFLKVSKGNWRNAIALADACERVMRDSEISKIDEQLVQTAGAWMARNN